MLDPWTRNQQIEQLRHFPEKLAAALEGATPQQLAARLREGGWTLRQIAHHIADANINGYVRTKLILTEEDPLLRTFEQDPWAELADAQDGPLEPTLALLPGLHARWAAALADLPAEAWQRTARHPERGPMTLESIVVFFVTHGQHHIDQILEIRRLNNA